MPTSKKSFLEPVKELVMSEVKPVIPNTDPKDAAMSVEDLQDFVATLNAGIATLVKPVREKVNLLEKVKANQIDVEKLQKDLSAFSKNLGTTTNIAEGTSIELQKVIASIPNILGDVKNIVDILLELFEVLKPILAIFKSEDLKASATKSESLAGKLKACKLSLEQPKIVQIETVKPNVTAPEQKK